MFLDEQELYELTDRKYASHQIKWLMQNGIKFVVSAAGKPKVLHSQIQHLLDFESKNVKRRIEPNIKALEKHLGLA